MGNTIKNYERKRRKERKEAIKEIHNIVGNHISKKFRENGLSDFADKYDEARRDYNV